MPDYEPRMRRPGPSFGRRMHEWRPDVGQGVFLRRSVMATTGKLTMGTQGNVVDIDRDGKVHAIFKRSGDETMQALEISQGDVGILGEMHGMQMCALECAHADCRMQGIAKLTAERFPVCNACGRPLSNPEPGTTDCGSPDMDSGSCADPRVP